RRARDPLADPLRQSPVDRVHPQSVAPPAQRPVRTIVRHRDRARALDSEADRSYPWMVPASRIAPALPAAVELAPGGHGAFLHRAEVRDVLAWVRLLVDPQDAAAVVRALARPPIELRQAHLARVIALARRRKLDLVAGLTAATESPQVPPEARERIERFASLHRSAVVALDELAPDAFLLELIELIGMPGRALLTVDGAAEQRASLQGLRRLADELVRAEPRSSSRELA